MSTNLLTNPVKVTPLENGSYRVILTKETFTALVPILYGIPVPPQNNTDLSSKVDDIERKVDALILAQSKISEKSHTSVSNDMSADCGTVRERLVRKVRAYGVLVGKDYDNSKDRAFLYGSIYRDFETSTGIKIESLMQSGELKLDAVIRSGYADEFERFVDGYSVWSGAVRTRRRGRPRKQTEV